MINLLPTTYVEMIRYARQNTTLRSWLLGVAAAILGLVVILAGGWVYINQQAKDMQKHINLTNQQLQAQNLQQVQKDAKEITGDITVINKILSQEVQFSELIQAIGNIMPPNTVLGTLSLSNKVTGGVDITANAKYGDSVPQIVANLTDPQNQLFKKADVVSVSCDTNPTHTYSCTVILRTLFSTTAQTKFLSFPGAKS